MGRSAAGPMRAWRAVALDMDGTSLSSEGRLADRTIEAIRRADAAGLRVVIATGRPANSVQPHIDALALPRPLPAVCFNGACALLLKARSEEAQGGGATPSSGEVLLSEELSADATAQVLGLCSDFGWCASYCLPDGACASPRGEEQETLLKEFERLEGVQQQRMADLGDLLAAGKLPLKVVAMVEDPEASAARARERLPEGLVRIVAAEMHVEFISPKVCKGHSLAAVCRDSLDIPLEDVIAFGDNHNDKEMLQLVGEGVAMKNAKESVKEVAKRTCAWTNDEEGIAKEIEAILEAGAVAALSEVGATA